MDYLPLTASQLYTNCPDDELEEKRINLILRPLIIPHNVSLDAPDIPQTPRTPAHRHSGTPQTPRTPSQFLAFPTPTNQHNKSSRLDAHAPAFVPSRPQPSEPVVHVDRDDDDLDDLNSRILSSLERDCSSSDSGNISPPFDDLAVEYVQLKLNLLKLTDLREPGDKTDASTIQALRRRLEVIKDDYYFDEKEAEARYRVELQKLESMALQARLRGTGPSVTQAPPLKKNRPPKLQPQMPVAPKAATDIFDADSEEVVGLMEILEEMPTTETTPQGTTVNVRDMALPKTWSGRTPKTLLKDTVAKTDRYAAITYSIISGASRVKRAAINIRWDGKNMGEWCMNDVACFDEGQAEQYIATIALHALTYPATEGFSAGASASSSNQTFFRLLPAVYRDLWDELAVARRARDDAINRTVWAKLRSILEPKLEVNLKVCNFFC